VRQTFLREAIGVAQGDTALFSDYADYADGGEMWTGQGPRERRRRVSVDTPFRAAPMVHVALSLPATDGRSNTRIDAGTDSITPEGVEIVLRSWGDSRVARMRVRWMAIGAAAHDEDWLDVS
jgi:hypothetical protein